MTPHMLDFVRTVAWYNNMQGPILEVGSYIEANQEHLDLRRAFPRGTPYLGTDVLTGPGVDRTMDLLDLGQVSAVVSEFKPKVILCLYVLEHVWEIQKAANSLASIWQRDPESWLFVSTHQNQPYHATGQYHDFWRITASGMKRLFDEAGLYGASVFVHPDSSNPSDVMVIRQPASMPWPTKEFEKSMFAATSHWEHYC